MDSTEDGEMLCYSQLDRLGWDKLIRAFQGDPDYQFEKDPDQLEFFYEEVAVKIVVHGIEPGVRYLLGRLDELDPLPLQGALCALAVSRSTLFEPEALFTRFLTHHDPLVQVRATKGLLQYKVFEAKEKILPLLRHADFTVVGAALEYMAHFFPAEARPHLIEALRSREDMLREWAVEIIDDTGAEDLLIEVAPLLKDPNPDVRRAAHWAIAKENLDISIDEAGGNDSVNS